MKWEKEKKKIAFILFSSLSMGAGIENATVQYCKYKPDEYKIDIFQTDFPKGTRIYESIEFDYKKVNLHTMKGYDQKFTFLAKSKFGIMLLLCVIWPALFLVMRILPEYRKFRQQIVNYDIVYCFGNYYSSLIPKGPIVIGSSHGWSPERTGILKGLFTAMVGKGLWWKRVSIFHLFSKFTWFFDRYNKFGFTADNGVEQAVFYPKVRPIISSKNKFVFMGRLVECKGVKRLIDAFEIATVKKAEIELHIIGKGPMSNLFKNAKNVTHHGFLSLPESARILRESDCFVYPTSCDSFPLVVLEALASGLYVIASDQLRGAFDEFEQIGILEYCPNNIDYFANRMINFIDVGVSKEKILEAQELISKKYSWEGVCRELYSYFDRYIFDNLLV